MKAFKRHRFMGLLLVFSFCVTLFPGMAVTVNAENTEISTVNIEFIPPEIGETIELDEVTAKQTPQLSFTVVSGEHYSIYDYDENNRMQWVDSDMNPLDGIAIEENSEYRFVLGLQADEGYCFGNDSVFKLNGKLVYGIVAQNADFTQVYLGCALDTPSAAESYDIWVGGTPVTAVNASDILGDGKVSYDADSKTLTLDGATVTAGGTGETAENSYGIYSKNALYIIAKGTSLVQGKDNTADSCGICAETVTITLSDNAVLTANGGSQTAGAIAAGKSCGITAKNGNVEINGEGTVNAIGGAGADESYGVKVSGSDLIVKGGILSAKSNGTGSVSLATSIVPVADSGTHLVLTTAEDGSSVYTVKPDTYYNITFNSTGSDITPPAAVTDADGKLVSLPIITKNDYDFRGWFTEEIDGTPISTDTVFTADTEIFAHWADLPRAARRSSAHSINTAAEENGSISVSSKSALSGSIITVSVSPDEGYVLDALTITDQTGKELPVTKTGDKYTFIMTDDIIKVTPVFVDENSIKVGKRTSPFYDITNRDYFYNAVVWAAYEGIANGTTEHTFNPNDACTRGQTVTFLWRAAGSPEPTAYNNPFVDVEYTDYFYKAVLWAYENGITAGTSYNKFSPYDTVTRGQTITFLYRLAGDKSKNNVAFSDIKSNDYYYDAVFWAYENDIAKGTSEGTFRPDDDCLRGQIVTFLYRYYC